MSYIGKLSLDTAAAIVDLPAPETLPGGAMQYKAKVQVLVYEALVKADAQTVPITYAGGMAQRKSEDLVRRGYVVIGYIHANGSGKYALSDSSVRWLTRAQYLRLMHEQDGSLFSADTKIAFDEFVKRTDWVQEEKDSFSFNTLDMHRADILRREIEMLRAQLRNQQKGTKP